jgi:putative PIN family toxin of toxin-antitoxin system
MRCRTVVDTNLWVRALLGGPVTVPILEAWRADRVVVLVSQPLLDELEAVVQRPRLRPRIDPEEVRDLVEQLRCQGEWVEAYSSWPLSSAIRPTDFSINKAAGAVGSH